MAAVLKLCKYLIVLHLQKDGCMRTISASVLLIRPCGGALGAPRGGRGRDSEDIKCKQESRDESVVANINQTCTPIPTWKKHSNIAAVNNP